MNVIEIYHNYLVYLQKIRESSDNFHASSSGTCFRKQMYEHFKYEKDEMEEKDYRLLRLGTIVHNEIEKSIQHHINNTDIINKIYVEEKIKIPDLNVSGQFDFGEHNKENNIFTLYDLKTVAAYKWTTKFGLKKNRKPQSDTNYKLQLGTYGLGIMSDDKFEASAVQLRLLWYNKNTSLMREQIVSSDWMDRALEYWTEMNDILLEYGGSFKEELTPEYSAGVPFQDWECKYCPYLTKWPSTLANKEKQKRSGRINVTK